MLVAVAGVSHRSAPVELRERISFPPCLGRQFIRRLRESGLVEEAVLLSTCNRTELYAVVEDERVRERIVREVSSERGVEFEALDKSLYWMTDADAVRHLFRVAGSLDSMVVGESQILGQVREAYRAATEEEAAGAVLNRLFHSAMRIGKRIRSETGIGDGAVSVPYVAVRLAAEVFGSLEGRRALVVGAGEMSELVIRNLRSGGVGEVRIANRTPARARELAERLGGRSVGLEGLEDHIREADVVVSSTGSGEWVVRADMVARALERREEPLFFVDIAVPRDIEPAVQNLPRAYLYDIDDLRDVAEHNSAEREAAVGAAEKIIGPAVLEYTSWLSTRHVVPVIRESRSEAERVRQHELSRFLKRLDLSEEERRVVEQLSRSLVNKLLHGPIADLKAAAQSPLEDERVRRRLFGLEGIEGVDITLARRGRR